MWSALRSQAMARSGQGNAGLGRRQEVPAALTDVDFVGDGPHSVDWHHHLAKQLLFHMERLQMVEDVRESDSHPHWWVVAPAR